METDNVITAEYLGYSTTTSGEYTIRIRADIAQGRKIASLLTEPHLHVALVVIKDDAAQT